MNSGKDLSGLSSLMARLIEAGGGRAAESCLWIGSNPDIRDALADQVAQSGTQCAFYLAPNSSGRRESGIDHAYGFDALPVSREQAPRLSDVLAYAQTVHEPVECIRGYCETMAALASQSDLAAIDAIVRDFRISKFDLVVILDEDVLTDAVIDRISGTKAIFFNRMRCSFAGTSAFSRLFANIDYVLAASDDHEHGGWALFVQRDRSHADLPIHFFTIVLNGEPFIRYHEQMLLELDCRWHWHIVEGVASLVKDTAWSVAAGGHIPDDLHRRGKSNDGTTEYLDELAKRYPNRVTIYRKPDDVFWDGKLEMVSAPIPHIQEPCLLWQIDADELWTADQVHAVLRNFQEQPERTAASFWCNYYVGPEQGISTRLNYAQNPQQEWLRVWRFQPGMIWDKHEPPVLAGVDNAGQSYDVGRKNPFLHRDTERWGAVFDHFAYSTPEQAQFKESYYGYKDAVKQWRALQGHPSGSGHLRDYFAWVSDDTMFDTVDRLGWTPLAHVDAATGQWRFRSAAELARLKQERRVGRPPRIVVDGVFFQLASSGIARVWVELFKAWIASGRADSIVLLDRGKTAPRIDGIVYRTIDAHSWDTADGDARYLQEICDMEGADLFLSTYYTTPTHTPTVFFGHDMIPERLGADLDDPWWRQKRRAIQYAAGHIMVSHSSADDMCHFHPDVARDTVLVAHNAVMKAFHPASADEVAAFRAEHGIERPFVMLVGERFGWKDYKNGGVVFAALALIPEEQRPLLVCVGGRDTLEAAGKAFLRDEDVRLLRLDDDGLRACFAAAQAYICPSRLEGFGLPVAEAMAVGCPALVCRNSSIPEVAGEAGIYFDPEDPQSLVAALAAVSDADYRQRMIAAGKVQAASFDQARSAEQIAAYCDDIVAGVKSGAIATKPQALADAFADAEMRRAAEAAAQQHADRLAALKHQLSSTVRISGEARIDPADLANDRAALVEIGGRAPDHSLLVAMERRLANAYARLRSAEGQEVGSAMPVDYAVLTDAVVAPQRDAASYDPAVPVELSGLGEVEGPYPEWGIKRAFRWQTSPRSVFAFEPSFTGPAVFEFDFSNLEPGQTLRVTAGERVLGEFTTPDAGWNCEWYVSYPIELSGDRLPIVIEASHSAQDDGHPQPRYIALHGVSLRPAEEPD